MDIHGKWVDYNFLAETQVETEESLTKINACTDMESLKRLLNVANEEVCRLESRMVSGQRTLAITSQELNALNIELQELIDKAELTESELERNDLSKIINELEKRIDRKKKILEECKISIIGISAVLAKAISERDAIKLQMRKLREEEESVAAQQRNETDEPNVGLVLS